MAHRQFDPETLPIAERYALLIGGIVPRPIALVGTTSPDGKSRNLAPFSFFNGIGSEPMTLLFCPANKDDGQEKDTLRNCKPREEGGAGEFVVNVVGEEILQKSVAASEPLAYGEEEFAAVGLTPVPGVRVAAPRVAESAISFECRTLMVARLNPGKQAGGNIVVGEVVMVHVREDVLDPRGRIDPAALRAVGRMGGLTYARTTDRLELRMGLRALDGGGA